VCRTLLNRPYSFFFIRILHRPVLQGEIGVHALELGVLVLEFLQSLELRSPGHIGIHYMIGTALVLKGEAQAALENMQREFFDVFRLIGLPMAYHALGDVRASDASLAELIEKHQQDAAYNIAHVLAYRNEADRAFEWLNKAVAYGDPGLIEIVGNPLFGNIQGDPRWLPFLESIGKSPAQLDAIKFEVTLSGQ